MNASAVTAASFPTPDLAIRSNDPAVLERVRGFARYQADAAEAVRLQLVLADLPGLELHDRLPLLRRAYDDLTRWRHELALAASGRLGTGVPLDASRFVTSIREGGANYDRLGYSGRMRAGSSWDAESKVFVGGEETPASAIIARYGELAEQRFKTEAPSDDVLPNPVRTFDGRSFAGNRLVRGDAARRVAEHLAARAAARGCDISRFETGGDPVYAVTADPDSIDTLHGIALVQLAGAFDLGRLERIIAYQQARYLLYQAPRTKKGSDATIRAFLVAVGAVLFGRPPVMEQDADLRCMVLGQAAATEMPSDDVLWNHIGRTLSGHPDGK